MPDLPHRLFQCPTCPSLPRTHFLTLNELHNHRFEQHGLPDPPDWETREGWTAQPPQPRFQPPYHRRWRGRLLPQNGATP